MNHRISDIQLLRGIAVLFVLIEHSRYNLIGQPGEWMLPFYTQFGGWTGVDLFFAISGFVIARDLIPRIQQSGGALLTTVVRFWARRATRLWPAAWLWLALILVAVVWFNHSKAFGNLGPNLDATLAGLFNYGNLRLMNVFGRAEYGVSFPYWSLSLEEQFYLLLPIVILLFRRWLPWVLVVGVVLQFFANRHVSLILMGTRSDALMLGVLLAMWTKQASYQRFEPTFLGNNRWLGTIVLVVLVTCLGAVGSSQHETFRCWVGVIALISTLLVFIGSYDKDYLMPDNRLKKIFLWFGSRSYSLYLTHIPAYFTCHEIWYRVEPMNTVFDKTYNLRFALTAMVILLVYCELTYRFVETPFRVRGKLFAARINLNSGWIVNSAPGRLFLSARTYFATWSLKRNAQDKGA
jgi:peptidoglycan/LPS O-acetylase OafA/YrhL